MKSNKIGYIYIAFSATFFAVIAIVGKTVMNTGINVFDMIVIQYLISTFMLLLYFLFSDITKLKLSKEKFKYIIIQGIVGSTGTTIFYYLSLQRVNAGVASMLLFTHPILVSIYFMISKTKKINITNNIALGFAILGSVMIVNIFNLDLIQTPVIGLIFGAIASVTYAFFNIYADIRLKDIEPLVITFYSSAIILIITIFIKPSFFAFAFVISPQNLFYLFELSVISGILPVIFLYKGISLIGSEKASIVATAELPITLVLAYILLRESMSIIQIIGAIFIIASIIILQNDKIYNNTIKE